MKANFAVSILILLLTGVVWSQPPGFVAIFGLSPDAAHGGQLFEQKCMGCHGANGVSTNSMFPRIGGQIPGYELIQLWNFREGLRPGTMMNEIAAGLSDQDIADLNAYLSSQTATGEPWADLDPALVEQGASIYALGNHASGVIACAVCHGANGAGVPEHEIPRLFGQSAPYVGKSLQEFAALPDLGIPVVSAMTINASRMTEEEMAAVAAYLASQTWNSAPE